MDEDDAASEDLKAVAGDAAEDTASSEPVDAYNEDTYLGWATWYEEYFKTNRLSRDEYRETWMCIGSDYSNLTAEQELYREHLFEVARRGDWPTRYDAWQATQGSYSVSVTNDEQQPLLAHVESKDDDDSRDAYDDREQRRRSSNCPQEECKPVLIACGGIFACGGVLLLLWMPFLLGYHFTSDAYWHFFWIIPLYLCCPVGIAGAASNAGGAIRGHKAAIGFLVGASLTGGAIAGLLFGVRAGKLVSESDRILKMGVDSDMCPSMDPATEPSAAAMWAQGSHFAQDNAGQTIWSGLSWDESSDDSTTYYCLTVSPILAPQGQSSQFHSLDGPPCVAPTTNPMPVSFWAVRSEVVDDDSSCDQAAVEWKAGGIIKDPNHVVVLNEHGDFGNLDSDGFIDTATGARDDFLRDNTQFSDHAGSKWVVMTDDPEGDAKAAQDEPWYYFGYTVAVWLLGTFCLAIQSAGR